MRKRTRASVKMGGVCVLCQALGGSRCSNGEGCSGFWGHCLESTPSGEGRKPALLSEELTIKTSAGSVRSSGPGLATQR